MLRKEYDSFKISKTEGKNHLQPLLSDTARYCSEMSCLGEQFEAQVGICENALEREGKGKLSEEKFLLDARTRKEVSWSQLFAMWSSS